MKAVILIDFEKAKELVRTLDRALDSLNYLSNEYGDLGENFDNAQRHTYSVLSKLKDVILV